jgi:hypothetical protein
MFHDLKAAILAVLDDADQFVDSGNSMVGTELLYTLQQEYNIHFIEPEDEQCNLIIKN